MKKSFAFLCAVFAVYSICAQTELSLKDYNLKGRVISVVENTLYTTMQGGKWTKKMTVQDSMTLKFNAEGLLWKIKKGNSRPIVYQYKDGRPICSYELTPATTLYKEKRYVERVDTSYAKVYEYNYVAGTLTEAVIKSKDGGTIVQKTEYHPAGYRTYCNDYEQTLEGATRTTIRRNGAETEVETLNAQRMPIKCVCTVKATNGAASVVIDYKYNEHGDCVSETYVTKSAPGKTQTSSAKLRYLTEGKRVFRYEYQYDSRGNWVEKKSWIDGEPDEWKTRTITYAQTDDDFRAALLDDNCSPEFFAAESERLSHACQLEESARREAANKYKAEQDSIAAQQKRLAEELLYKKKIEDFAYLTATKHVYHSPGGVKLVNIAAKIKKCNAVGGALTFETSKKESLGPFFFAKSPIQFPSVRSVVHGNVYLCRDNDDIMLIDFEDNRQEFLFLVQKDSSSVFEITKDAANAVRTCLKE